MEPSVEKKVPEAELLMVGLDESGKTTILYRLYGGEAFPTVPTIGYNMETVKHKDTTFTITDVGGKATVRVLWNYYCENKRGLIFVVDSSDRERTEEAKTELGRILAREELKDAVLLILANKQDLGDPMSTEEIAKKLDLQCLTTRNWYIQKTSAISGDGLNEGLDWVAKQLEEIEIGAK